MYVFRVSVNNGGENFGKMLTICQIHQFFPYQNFPMYRSLLMLVGMCVYHMKDYQSSLLMLYPYKAGMYVHHMRKFYLHKTYTSMCVYSLNSTMPCRHKIILKMCIHSYLPMHVFGWELF